MLSRGSEGSFNFLAQCSLIRGSPFESIQDLVHPGVPFCKFQTWAESLNGQSNDNSIGVSLPHWPLAVVTILCFSLPPLSHWAQYLSPKVCGKYSCVHGISLPCCISLCVLHCRIGLEVYATRPHSISSEYKSLLLLAIIW